LNDWGNGQNNWGITGLPWDWLTGILRGYYLGYLGPWGTYLFGFPTGGLFR